MYYNVRSIHQSKLKFTWKQSYWEIVNMKSSFYDNKDKLCPSNFKVVSLCAMSTSWTGAMLYSIEITRPMQRLTLLHGSPSGMRDRWHQKFIQVRSCIEILFSFVIIICSDFMMQSHRQKMSCSSLSVLLILAEAST